MLKFATIWCDLWCPETPPCEAFETDDPKASRCDRCGHPERCHEKGRDANTDGTAE